MKMNTYNCVNPDEVHMTESTKLKITPEKEEDLVQKFKDNPNSFFSSIIPPAKP